MATDLNANIKLYGVDANGALILNSGSAEVSTWKAVASLSAGDVANLANAKYITTGFDAIMKSATSQISSATDDINNLLTNFNPSDPGQMIKAQQALAIYNLNLTVVASIVKSFEDTSKGVAQKI